MDPRTTVAASVLALSLAWLGAAQEGGSPPPEDGLIAPIAEPVAAATPGGESNGIANEPPPRTLGVRTTERWLALSTALEAANPAAVDDKLRSLLALRNELGVTALPPLSAALTAQGFQKLAARDTAAAEQRFSAALELDPYAAHAHYGRAAAGRQSGAGFAVVSDLVRGLRTRFASLRSAPFAAAKWLSILGLGLVIASVLAILALAIAKQALLRHDIEELLKGRIEGPLAAVLAWTVLVLPLLLTLDLYWAALYAAFLVWAYASTKDEVILVLSVASLMLAVPIAGVATQLLENARDPLTSASVRYLEGVIDDGSVAALEAYADQNPEDEDAQILLGLAYERSGDPRKAIVKYRSMSGFERNPTVLNNLGAISYRLDEKDKAFENWKKASDLDVTFAPTLYNLSLYYGLFFEFGKKDEYFGKARALDPKRLDQWVRQGGVVDAGVDREVTARRLWLGPPGSSYKQVQAALYSPHALGGVLVLILGPILARKRRQGVSASACVKCGRAYCKRCTATRDRKDYCLQCIHLFIRKDGVSPQMRAQKVAEIQQNQFIRRVTAIAIGLIAPGGGQIARNRSLLGYAFLVVWGLSLAAYFLLHRLILEPGFVAGSLAVVPASAPLVVGGVIWLAANLANLAARD